MLDLLLVGCLVALLGYASHYDYKHKLIEMWVVWLVLALACMYFFASYGNGVEVLAVLFFTAVIWGMPTLFGLNYLWDVGILWSVHCHMAFCFCGLNSKR